MNMSDVIEIFGAEMSPYSVKLRAFCRYKNIPHIWQNRGDHEEAYKKLAKLPIIPLAHFPDGTVMQDSTPIMDHLETTYPQKPTQPENETLHFISILLEEYGDEWLNKIMFHFRWYRDIDQTTSAYILARSFNSTAEIETIDGTAQMIKKHMSSRGHFVGSSEATAPLIQQYFLDLAELFEAHLESRPFLFGGKPVAGDFGTSAQVYEMSLDPTLGGHLRASYPNLLAWCLRMQDPQDRGSLETWEELSPTLKPILSNIASYFLPWSLANAKALINGEEEFSVDLAGKVYTQQPQKYHAKSLNVLRQKYEIFQTNSALNDILAETDIKKAL
jgi:glutathione S-transferase